MLACTVSQHWPSMTCSEVALQPVKVVCGITRNGYASATQNSGLARRVYAFVQSTTCRTQWLQAVRLLTDARDALHARVDREVLALYQQRVAELVPRLQPPHVPAYCVGLPAHSRGVVGGAAPSAQPPPPPPHQTDEARSVVKLLGLHSSCAVSCCQ